MTELSTLIAVAVLSTFAGYWLAVRQTAPRILSLEADRSRLQDQLGQTTVDAPKVAIHEYKDSDEFKAMLRTQFEAGRAEGSDEALRSYKKSDEFSALLDIEHAKGKAAGGAEELEKFTIAYTPVLIDHETFFSRKIDAGYEMQLFYAGFPIGDPARRITHHEQKSKDENITKALAMADKALQIAAAIATKQKIPVSISRTPKRERAKR